MEDERASIKKRAQFQLNEVSLRSPPTKKKTFSMAGPLLEAVQKHTREAEEEYNMIQQLEVSFQEGKSLTEDQQMLLKSKYIITNILAFLKQVEVRISCRSSSKKHGRYLCISNGLKLVCLDLKDGLKQEPIYEAQPLPKIHTLVAEEILGQQQGPQLSGTVFSCFAFVVKGSVSWAKYSLSTDGANFCLSEQDTCTRTPVSFPHCIPCPYSWTGTIQRSIPKVWLTCSALSKIPNPDPFLCMRGVYNQIVIADKVYSIDNNRSNASEFEVYNTTTSLKSKYFFPLVYCGMTTVRHVAELLLYAFVRCIGKLEHSDSSNPLYLVIALMMDLDIPEAAVAYLVTSTGHVLCYQLLPHFIGGVSEIHSDIFHIECRQWTVISVDEKAKTWCAIVPLKCLESASFNCLERCDQLLFISTFMVEENLYDILHGPLLPSILAEKRKEGDDIWDAPYARELNFLNVEAKEWNVYKFDDADMGYSPHLSACFMSTQ